MSSRYGAQATPKFNNIAEAAQMQQHQVVLEMVGEGHDINGRDFEGNTALHWACWFKLDEFVQKLLERKADQDIGNDNGETPVHWAAKAANLPALQLLTMGDCGLLSVRDVDGFTPFIISAQNDSCQLMEWMYLKGISVEEQDDQGRTALQWACFKGHRRTVQWLLSRGASIAHRDHEGMSAVHWAALKGQDPIAEMLIEVGAVQLLALPDRSGDTPIILARRKGNRSMEIAFQKSRLLNCLIGRPSLSRNNFANLYICFVCVSILIFLFILAPNLWAPRPGVVICWSLLMFTSMCLWARACLADPGWVRPGTIHSQQARVSKELGNEGPQGCIMGFDEPLEGQIAAALRGDFEVIPTAEPDVLEAGGSDMSDMLRLEREQNTFNFQRQMVARARRRLDDSQRSLSLGGCWPVPEDGYAASGAELQPLVPDVLPTQEQESQLRNTSSKLREKCKETGESLGRERVRQLQEEGQGEYVEFVDRGDFKQVCIVCRARREMRSHHCKECGRCVHRLDHHCPWIDNCVGIGNQRSFFCFIGMLFLTLASFYIVVYIYVVESVLPTWIGGEMWAAGPGGGLALSLSELLVLTVASFNTIWLIFVGALLVRHTTYILVNITTFEVLASPPHVQKRFPRRNQKFWFLEDFSLVRGVKNCTSYWRRHTGNDAEDFGMIPENGEAECAAPVVRDASALPCPSGSGPGYASLGPGRPTGPPQSGVAVAEVVEGPRRTDSRPLMMHQEDDVPPEKGGP